MRSIKSTEIKKGLSQSVLASPTAIAYKCTKKHPTACLSSVSYGRNFIVLRTEIYFHKDENPFSCRRKSIFMREKIHFHKEETSKSAVKGCESAWTGSATSRRIIFPPEVFGNLHGGNQKFFRTSKSFFRSFISFFRTFISPLRGDFGFPPSYLSIPSEELNCGRRKKKKTQPPFVQRLSLICIVSVHCQKERQRLVW